MNPYVSNDLSAMDATKFLLSIDMVFRQRQISLLASERTSIRQISAPFGFGKSCLAFSYGKLAFGPRRFWWVDASDPRFLLGLDSPARHDDELARVVDSRTPSLLVFDSLPALSSGRVRAFESLLLRAHSRGWEIVICSRPESTLDLDGDFAELRRSSSGVSMPSLPTVKLLRSVDLLLSAEEIRASSSGLEPDGLAQTGLSGIACCAFGHASGRAAFLEGLVDESADLSSCLCALALVSSARSVSDLAEIAGIPLGDVRRALEVDWPCVGLDSGSDECRPAMLSEDERLRLFSRSSAMLGEVFSRRSGLSVADSSVSLSRNLCRYLLEEGNLSLAARVVARSRDVSKIASFVDEMGLRLLCSCEPLALCELMGPLDSGKLNWDQRALFALSLSLLGDAPAALALTERKGDGFGTRALVDGGPTSLLNILVLVLDGRVAPSRQGVRAAIENAMVETEEGKCGDGSMTSFLVRSCRVSLMGEAELASLVDSVVGEVSMLRLAPELKELTCALVLRGCMGLRPRAKGRLWKSLSALASAVSNASGEKWIEIVLAGLVASWVDGSSFEECDLASRARLTNESLMSQRATWRGRSRAGRMGAERGLSPSSGPSLPLRKGGFPVSSSRGNRSGESSSGRLRLFGGFELSLPVPRAENGAVEELEPVKLRAKAKVLVGLLAANHGCEVSREWLGGQLWPLVDSHSQKVSFYALWSYVGRTVRLYGVPPFLESTRTSASFCDGVIGLDVKELDEACSGLEGGPVSPQDCIGFVKTIKDTYRGPFMPGVEHGEIESIRLMWEKRVIDALMRSRPHLESVGELQTLEEALGLAFRIDPSRQDVCHALMKVQRRLGRHADATSSFVKCQKASADNHGLGVSPQLSDLYQEVLDEVS